MIIDNDLGICETLAKPVTRSIVFPFFEISLEKRFWAIQRFHHL